MNENEYKYHKVVVELVDKVESTIQTLEELDNFYSKLGNMEEFSAIIDSWPLIHRNSLPAIIKVHHKFIAKSGVSGNDMFVRTNKTSRK